MQSFKSLASLWIHNDKFSTQEILMNSDYFPNLKAGDLVEIHHPNTLQKHEPHKMEINYSISPADASLKTGFYFY